MLQTGIQHGILPSVALAAAAGTDISAPPEITDLLDAILSLNRERNDHIWNELKIAVRLLNDIGIEPVLLKGAAYLASDTYSDCAGRYLLDLDLLLPETESQRAVSHLLANGYSIDERDAFGRFRHHHPQVSRGSVGTELHHKIGLGRSQYILPAKEVIAGAALLHLDGLRVRVPSPTHLAIHLVLHSQLQHPYNERIWPPLRALYDLVKIDQRFGGSIDWREIAHRFTRARQYGLLVLHLLDVHDALGWQLPFVPRLGPVTRLRKLRRTALRLFPALRYADPIYMGSVLLTRRLRMLRNVLVTPGGLQHLISHIFAPSVVEGLLLDVREGRGH
ncbi:MAG: nucleotidyltransferase family protein [Acidobacteriaceae bacterium]|nr:nucleotidyltransferase family protein [Acidobacteriaceae bacterium]